MKPYFFFTIIFLLCNSLVFCQADTSYLSIDKQLNACLDSDKNSTTYGMIECEIRARDAWDAALNKYYKLLMLISSEDEKNKLRTAQKNWLVFRNNELVFSSTMYNNMGGTIWSAPKVDVDVNLVKQRTLELKAYYEDKQPK